MTQPNKPHIRIHIARTHKEAEEFCYSCMFQEGIPDYPCCAGIGRNLDCIHNISYELVSGSIDDSKKGEADA